VSRDHLRELQELGERLEAKYDRAMGGVATRPYRELLGYCAGKLVLAGAEAGDVILYVQEVLYVAEPVLEAARDAGGSGEGGSA
jgi:hypothetical protein